MLKIVGESAKQISLILIEARVIHITKSKQLIYLKAKLIKHEVSLVYFLFFSLLERSCNRSKVLESMGLDVLA